MPSHSPRDDGASRRDFLISGATVVAAAAVPTAAGPALLDDRRDSRSALRGGPTRGGGDAVPYYGRCSSRRMRDGVPSAAVRLWSKITMARPPGLAAETFDQIRAAVLAD